MRSPLVWLGALVVSAHAAFWMEDIQHQGIQPFNTDNTYRVFRNVKDFGAKGDGSTDDTDAIQRAMSEGGRCSPFNCNGATVSPAVVYFPSGTYLINSTIVDYFYTMIIGDPNDRPVLKATSSFNGGFMLDGNPYVGPKMAWLAINTFFRQIRNIELDISEKQGDLIALHWPTSQATSIQNAVFRMAPLTSGFQHQGMLIEEGSGGFMSDLEFYGGMYGMNIGNQQFTMRNLKFRGCWTAIHQIWDWTWTYQGLDIADVEYGIYIDHAKTPDGSFANLAAASVIVMDSRFENVPVAVHGSRIFGANDTPPASGSLILNEVEFSNCSVILEDRSNTTVIEGGEESKTVEAFVLGHVYDPINGHRDFQGEESSYFIRPRKLTGADGMAFYTQSKPSYATEAVTSFVSARTSGCAGDANTDDTACLNELFASAAAGNKIVFLDAGYYLVTDTVYVPPGSRIVGEALSSVILASGPAFSDIDAPLPVLQVGKQSRRGKSEEGRVELSDMVVSTQGGTAGAIMIEYNLYTSDSTNYSTGGAPSGMWDVHVRIGGFAGSQLTKAECPITNGTVATPDNIKRECMAAYLSTHITKGAGGLYHENCWLWTADHDIEAPGVDQVTVFAGRGMLIESKRGRVWVLASGSEHHQLYNYQVAGATDVYMGVIQSETPYYQPNPPATLPFPAVAALNDPTFDDCPDQEGDVFGPENPACAMSWGLRVIGDAKNVVVAGAGLYSFFQNNELGCNPSDVPGTGAWCQARMFQAGDFGASGSGPYRNETAGALTVYGYQTVGATSMITRFGEDVEMWDDNIAGFTSGIMVYKHNA